MEDPATLDEEWPMVLRDGAQLLTKNEPFVIHGFNTYWLMVFAVDPETRHKVTDVFAEAKAAGLNTCRTWAFNDGGWRALHVSPFNYDEEVFQVCTRYV
jgi:mannan endo-1,4-beta-mannosidase